VLSTSVLEGGYYGGSDGEEIMLNGTVIYGGIGEVYKSYSNQYVQSYPIIMMKYKDKLYRCHVTLNIDLDRYSQSEDGFEVHCWGRRIER